MRGSVKLQLARQQFEGGVFEEAVAAIEESIALDPDEADAYVLLARANLELGRPASARQALEAAERTGLSSADLIYMQGVILEQRDRIEDAVEKYSQARRLDGDNLDYLVAQAECLVALNRADEALALLDENADRFDDDGTLSTLSAHIAGLRGDADDASRRYRQAYICTPDSRLVSKELGRLMVRTGRFDEAVAVLRPLLESPDGTEVGGDVRRALATSYLALGDPASAKQVLREYAPVNPDDALAQLLWAKAALATDDLISAMRAVDLAQRREGDRPELWFVRAAVQWKRGRLTAAASDLRDVLQNNPGDVEAHCLLAEVLHDQQHREAARTHYRRALAIDPACTWATAGLKALAEAKPPPNRQSSPKLTSAEADVDPVQPRP